MKQGITMLLLTVAALCPLGSPAQGIASVLEAFQSTPKAYDGSAVLRVTLPGADKEVEYQIFLTQRPAAAGDTLSLVDYLIGWKSQSPLGPVEGFSAYHDGSHYRYRDHRLQEYHWDWDSVPFIIGVQQQAQFVHLLPAMMHKEILDLYHDSLTAVTFNRNVIKAITSHDGVVACEREYHLNPEGQIMKMVMESNPGSIAEQTIEVAFSPAKALLADISEDELARLYPDAFGRYRQSNFRIENLPGEPLPGFALPTSTGERYTRHLGDPFRTPTLVAIIDPSTGFASNMVQQLRVAVDQLPYNADLILAMVSTNADLAETVADNKLRPGEHLLLNARSLSKDCGVSTPPVVIITNKDGSVKDVVLGYNNDLATDVLQKAALAQ